MPQPRGAQIGSASRANLTLPIREGLHVKVKGEANPYDPAFETYFEAREGFHMRETFRGTRMLRYIWNEQRGLCTVCQLPITRTTGWRFIAVQIRGLTAGRAEGVATGERD